MINLFYLLVMLLLAPMISAQEMTTGQQWIEKMQQSMKSLNYQGTVIFFKNNQLDSMKYSHAMNQGLEQEHLESLNSPMREIIRNTDVVSCLYKDNHRIEINHHPSNQSFILDLPPNLSQQKTDYQFTITEQAIIAKRDAQAILIKPNDYFRYARKIWIDKHHFLPLKTEVYSPSGIMLEQVMFTDLNIRAQLTLPNMDLKHAKTIEHIHQSRLQDFKHANFKLNNIPSGFKEILFIQMKMHGSVDHLLLSDGFSSLSIYQEQHAETISMNIHSLGSMNSLVKKIGGYQFVLIGSVPIKTIQFIAQGIQLKKP
ncbi:MAG: MucB/RseB C-terminal domain-containing protein [Methylococcales bacterium]|nr:MucB/RseB C-terminal domain-containing protein [Methylococcales bacterium]